MEMGNNIMMMNLFFKAYLKMEKDGKVKNMKMVKLFLMVNILKAKDAKEKNMKMGN